MTGKQIVLSIDVGGSGLKLSAYDVDGHRSIASSVTRWMMQAPCRYGEEFDVEPWWRTTVTALKAFICQLETSKPWTILGVTVAAMRIPFVLLDENGVVIRSCMSNADRRATSEVAELRSRYGNGVIYSMTGHWLTPEFGLPKLLWLHKHEPHTMAQTRTVMQLHDWFIYQLCGAVCSEASSAAMSQVLAADGQKWATELMLDLDLPEAWFPDLVPAGTRAGELRPEVAAATGLPPGTPVHVGGGDTQMSALGAGALHDDSVPVIIGGTTVPIQWAIHAEGHQADDSYPALYSRQLLQGWGTVEMNAGGVGAVLDKLRQLDPTLCGVTLVHTLVGLGVPSVQAIDDSDELLITIGSPVFGSRSWAGNPGLVLRGLQPSHTAADIYLAALQCSALAVSELLDALGTQVSHIKTAMLTGGLAANERWVRLVADTAQITVAVPDQKVVAGIGGASVVTGESLWRKSDTDTCTLYHPQESEITQSSRAAYARLWNTPKATAPDGTRMLSCEH